MVGLIIILGIILFCLTIIVVFGVFGIKGSERWFPWP